MKQAILVFGPESAGNRYLTRLFAEAGFIGRGAFSQPFDNIKNNYSVSLPPVEVPRIVIFRSLPHGGCWPNISAIIEYLQGLNYDITVFVMFRDQTLMAKSQLKIGHVKTIEEGMNNITKAYPFIFDHLMKKQVRFIPVVYLNLERASYKKWLFDQVGVTLPEDHEPFENGDIKYLC
jgi:hypothetical protein